MRLLRRLDLARHLYDLHAGPEPEGRRAMSRTITATVHDRADLGRLSALMRQAVLSAPWVGRYVILYGNRFDGWREFRPTSDLGTARRDARRLNGGAR